MSDADAARFDAMFAASDDPWSFRTRWYEARKRALTLAILPRQRFAHGFEVGCANGELTRELASRCDRMLAMDVCDRAIEIARLRLADCSHVALRCGALPDAWPGERFDLIVLSEVGYYLSREHLHRLVRHCRASLTGHASSDARAGVLLACHWRSPIESCELDGSDVHEAIEASLGLPRLSQIAEADFLLDVWSTDPCSVAQLEGLA